MAFQPPAISLQFNPHAEITLPYTAQNSGKLMQSCISIPSNPSIFKSFHHSEHQTNTAYELWISVVEKTTVERRSKLYIILVITCHIVQSSHSSTQHSPPALHFISLWHTLTSYMHTRTLWLLLWHGIPTAAGPNEHDSVQKNSQSVNN